jgi:DNA-binding response OmpR family regulator
MRGVDFKLFSTLVVLYVEDDDGVREKMLLNIGDIFQELIVAVDGEDGFEKFRENRERINLIISDIKMPKRDGLSMVEEIREESKVPVVITTAFNELDYLHKSISIGVNEYILKPVKLKELFKLISKQFETVEDKRVEIKEFYFSISRNELFEKEKVVPLTLQERKFLYLLFRNIRQTLTYETIQNELWEDYVPETTIRSLARRVRKKFPYIETVSGVGYKISEL